MNMSAVGFAAVSIGAILGAWLRWGLAIALNAAVPNLPLGTLVANLVGSYIVGVPAEWRLFVITGFLGSLTTFSTFSAEAVDLLAMQRYGWAMLHIGSHLAGSLAMTVLGLCTVRWLSA
jgi:CrcB protein